MHDNVVIALISIRKRLFENKEPRVHNKCSP
jgi:hypothetical protein